MGVRSRHDVAPADVEPAAELLKGLANPHRLMIVRTLMEGERAVFELEAALKISQASLSRHLGSLREAGIISGRHEGKGIIYAISDPRAGRIVEALRAIFSCATSAGTRPLRRAPPPDLSSSNHDGPATRYAEAAVFAHVDGGEAPRSPRTSSPTYLGATLGGVLIGLSGALFLLLDGRVPGISGIVADLMRTPSSRWLSNLLFVAGLVLGPVLFRAAFHGWPLVRTHGSFALFVAAGLLVGFGTRLGSGCTSGHGVCGLTANRRAPPSPRSCSRLSPPRRSCAAWPDAADAPARRRARLRLALGVWPRGLRHARPDVSARAFLDVFGPWDPSLAFVLVGAVVTSPPRREAGAPPEEAGANRRLRPADEPPD